MISPYLLSSSIDSECLLPPEAEPPPPLDPITVIFSGGSIILNIGDEAVPLPSVITVSGITGTVLAVRILINNIVITDPTGGLALFCRRSSGIPARNLLTGPIYTYATIEIASGINLLFTVNGTLRNEADILVSGSYDLFMGTVPDNTTLLQFAGFAPNGDWELYAGSFGRLSALTIESWQVEIDYQPT